MKGKFPVLITLFLAAFFIQSALSGPVSTASASSYVGIQPNTTITIDIGTGSTAGGSGTFFCDQWNYTKNQLIYLQSEIGYAGTITKVGFHVYNGATGDNWDKYVSISIGHTTSSSWSSASWLSPGTEVFNRTSYTMNTVSGTWHEITLDSTFAYNNVNNLLVTVATNQSTANKLAYTTWYTSTQSDYKRVRTYGDAEPLGIQLNIYRVDIRLTMTGVNVKPNVVTLDSKQQMDNAKVPSATPRLKWNVPTDPENDNLNFQVQIDDDPAFGSPAVSKRSDISPTGFGGTDSVLPNPPFTAGSGTAWYDVQALELSNGVTYWWRARAYDGNNYGDWSDKRSFTVDTSLTKTAWHQTTGTQLSTGSFSGTEARNSPNDDVVLMTYTQPANYLVYEYPGGTQYSWYDMTGATSVTWQGGYDDYYSLPITLPSGFDFKFYDTGFIGGTSWFNVSMNGWMQFGNMTIGSSDYGSGTPFPAAAAAYTIAPAWFDGVESSCTYKLDSSAGSTNEVFTIQWTAYRYYTLSNSVDIQVNIFERTHSTMANCILIQFSTETGDWTSVFNAKTGVNRGDGLYGVQRSPSLTEAYTPIDIMYQYAETLSTGTFTSPMVDYDDNPDTPVTWGLASWSESLGGGGGDISVKVQYYSGGAWYDTGLSSSNPASPIDLTSLNTVTYNQLRLVATLTRGGVITPQLLDWTITWAYGGATPPSTPTPSTPINNSRLTGNSVTLTWSASTGTPTITYHLYFGTSSNPSWYADTTSTSYGPISTTDGTTYYWYLTAQNTAGTSARSAIFNFRENAKPSAPTTTITPSDGATGLTAGSQSVTWTAGSADTDGDTVWFYWFVDTDDPPASPYTASGGSATNTNSTSFTTSASTTYYWRVIAWDKYEYSSWSNGGTSWSFSTQTNPPNAPTGLTVQGYSAAPGLTHITDHYPALAWTFSDPDGGDVQGGYQIQIGTTAGNNDVWDSGQVNSGTSSATYAGSTALTDGSSYWYRVKVKDNHGSWGTWSSDVQFHMNSRPSAPTTPITPTDNTIGLSPGSQSVTWTAGAADGDGDTVWFYWFVDPDNPPVSPYFASGGSATNTNSTTFTTSASATYYWRVVAWDGFELSQWSNGGTAWSFSTTSDPPNAATGLSVESQTVSPGIDHIVSHTPLFAWTFSDPNPGDVQGAYRINIGTSAGSSDVWDSGNVTSSTNSANYGGSTTLTDGSTYFFRVLTRDNHGVWGLTWSSDLQFKMNRKATVTTPILPLNNSVLPPSSTQTVNWTGPADPDGDTVVYYWFVDNESTISSPYLFSGGSANWTNSTVFTTDYAHTYWWKAVAWDGWEYYSGPAWRFSTQSTPPNVPTGLSVEGKNTLPSVYHIIMSKPMLTWKFTDPDIGDTQGAYQIYIGTTAGGNDIWDSGQINSSATSAPYNGSTALIDGKFYNFTVRVSDNSGMWSDWSGSLEFRMNTPPPLPQVPISPINGAVLPYSSAQTVAWTSGGTDAEGDTVTYACQVNETGAAPGATYDQSGLSSTNSNTFSTVVLKTYYWRVRSNDSWENSTWVGLWHFSTSSNAPFEPKGLGVQGQTAAPGITHIIIHKPLLNWTFTDPDGDAQGAYQVEVRTASGGGGILLWDSGQINGAATSTTYNGGTALVDGSTYYFRVTTKDDKGLWGPWSEVSFRMNTPPPTPVLSKPADKSTGLMPGNQTVNWSAATDAEGDAIKYSWEVDDTLTISTPFISSGNTNALNSSVFITDYSKSYWWHVMCNDSYQSSSWSVEWNFSTLVKDVTQPFITTTSPVNSTIIADRGMDITVDFSEGVVISTVSFNCTPDPDPSSWTVSWSGGNKRAIFNHTVPFSLATTYTFSIVTAQDVAGNSLGLGPVPNPWIFSTITPTPTSIENTNPPDGATDVPVTRDITINFTAPMNTSSVTYNCTPTVPGWASAWSAGDTILTLTHDNFATNTTYTFNITAGSDKNGTALSASLVPMPWTFTTAAPDNVAPNITSTSPRNMQTSIALDTDIIVNFSEAMDTSTLSYNITPSLSGLAVAWSLGDKTLTISHDDFTPGTQYLVKITTCNDTAGNPLGAGSVPNPWWFQTKMVDKTAPKITSTVPMNGASDVALTQSIIVTFSEPMNKSTVAFTCNPDPSPGGWSVSWGVGDTQITLSHPNNFTDNASITVTITSGKDLAGNDLASGSAPNPWTFKTKKLPPVIPDPTITLTQPNGGETLDSGTSYDIEWSVADGTAPYTVQVGFSTDSGTTFTDISGDVAQASAGVGKFTWTVPPINSSGCVVRLTVADSALKNASDDSDAVFTVQNIIIEKFGTLLGNITGGGDNKALPNAGVSLVSKTTGQRRTATTDASGHYEITDIELGDYWLNISKTDYVNKFYNITISDGVNKIDVSLSAVQINQEPETPVLLYAGIAGIVIFIVILLLLLMLVILPRRRKKKADADIPPHLHTPGPHMAQHHVPNQHPTAHHAAHGTAAPHTPAGPKPYTAPPPPPSEPHPMDQPVAHPPGYIPPPPPPPAQPSVNFGHPCPKCGKMNDPEDHMCFWCGSVI